jgi:hypothetical protein
MSELSVITGIKLPENQGSVTTLMQYTAAALVEHFGHYTMPMVRLAFQDINPADISSKSYGRNLSVSDLHTVLDKILPQVQAASEEVEKVEQQEIVHREADAERGRHIMRQLIQEMLDKGDFSTCTFAVFNQLAYDKWIDDTKFYRGPSWTAYQEIIAELREEIRVAESMEYSKDQPLKGVVDVRELKHQLVAFEKGSERLKSKYAQKELLRFYEQKTKLYEKEETK